jgi:hypothetical protein
MLVRFLCTVTISISGKLSRNAYFVILFAHRLLPVVSLLATDKYIKCTVHRMEGCNFVQRNTGGDQSVDLVQHCLLNPHFTVGPPAFGGPILEEVNVDVPLLLVIDRDSVERACTKSREMTQGGAERSSVAASRTLFPLGTMAYTSYHRCMNHHNPTHLSRNDLAWMFHKP